MSARIVGAVAFVLVAAARGTEQPTVEDAIGIRIEQVRRRRWPQSAASI